MLRDALGIVGIAALVVLLGAAEARAQDWRTHEVDISTGEYADPDEGYRGDLDVRWTIEIPDAARVRLVFDHLDLEDPFDYLYVVPGLHDAPDGTPWPDAPQVLRLTGRQDDGYVTRPLDGNRFTLYLHTDVNNPSRRAGFAIDRVEWLPAEGEALPGLELAIPEAPAELEAGDSFQFTARTTVVQEGTRKAYPIEPWDPTWEALTPEGRPLAISGTGLFEAPRSHQGEVTVRATYEGASDEVSFRVVPPPPVVVGVRVEPAVVDLELDGGPARSEFSARVRMSDGSSRAPRAGEIAWSVEPGRATVEAGRFTAQEPGTYSVVATHSSGRRGEAVANVHAPAPVASGGGNRVVVAIPDDRGGREIADALEEAGFVVVGIQAVQPFLDGRRPEALYGDRARAQEIAGRLHARGEADFLIVGRLQLDVRPFNETFNSQTVVAELETVAVNGANTVEVWRAAEEGVGSATRERRATREGIEAAGEAVGRILVEEFPEAAETPEAEMVATTIQIRDIDREQQATSGRLFRTLLREIDDLRLSGIRYDAGARRLVAIGHYPGGAGDLERAVREAVEEARVGDEFVLVGLENDRIVLRHESPYRTIPVHVRNLSPARYRDDADAFTGLVSSLPGVAELERSFDDAERTLTVRVTYDGSPSDLDDRLWRVIEGTVLGGLEPVSVDDEGITYRVASSERSISILVRNVDASDLRVRGAALTEILRGLPGVTDLDRSYDENANRLEFGLRYVGRAFELDRALWSAARRQPDLRGLTVAPSDDATLAYELPATHPRRIVVRVSNLSPDEHRESGIPFRHAVADLPGVAGVEESYHRDRALLEVRVDYSGEPTDLDRAIWEQVIRGSEEFADLVPGDSHQNVLTFLHRTEEDGTVGYVIRVSNLSPASYSHDGRALVDLVRGLDGVEELEAEYDRVRQELSISVRYPGRPFELEDAIWQALEGRSLAQNLSPDTRSGNEIDLVFLVKRGEESRIVARLENLAPNRHGTVGARFADLVQAVDGVRGADPSYDGGERTLDVPLWFRGYPQDLFDALTRALARDSSLADVQAVGLDGNVVRFTADPGATSAGSGPSSIPGNVSELVREALPGVVIVRARPAADRDLAILGTGFLVHRRGYILTSDRVIRPAARDGRIEVETVDGRTLVARLIDRNETTGLALLKVPGQDHPALPIGESSGLEPGNPLVVIGNPHGLGRSVSVGIVSGLDRERGRLQTDASIHAGNGGGPALGADGEVVGITVSGAVIEVRGGRRVVGGEDPGLGFVVPIDHARNLLDLAGER